jgi:hypothetical protein
VTTVKIATAAVTTDKIAPRAVTGNKINQMGATHGQVLTWVTGSTNDWMPTSVSAWAWALAGNSGTNPTTNFLGTTDAQPLVIRTNNTERLRVTATGNVGIGTTSPTATLHVVGTAQVSGNTSVGGNLSVGGNGSVTGNLTVDGNTTLGNNVAVDLVTFTARVQSDVVPSANNAYDLGTNTLRWRDGWFSGTVTSQDATVTSLTPGSVIFAGTGGVLSQNNANFYWDNANARLGIGTATPAERLQVHDGNVVITNSSTAGQLRLHTPGGTNYTAFVAQAQTGNITYTLPQDLSLQPPVTGAGILQSDASGNLSWLNPEALTWTLTGNSITGTEFLGTTNNQPLVIQVNSTQTFQFNTNLSLQRDAGGNSRGTNAVDLQSARTAATQVASGNYSVIGGGRGNTASSWYATVGGGLENTASGGAATVGGGSTNTASGSYATVGGGWENTASNDYATVGGGYLNAAIGIDATVGGGWVNIASNFAATVGGGQSNTASGSYATVGGGWVNIASNFAATVGGGVLNTASGDYSAIPGGYNLRVGGRSFGFSGQTSMTQTDLSTNSNIAAFVDVDLWLYSRDRTQASQLRFYEAQAHGSGANYVALQAPTSLSVNTTYTLPASLTTTNTVQTGILQTDASGNLSWVDPSALAAATAWALAGNSIASAWDGTSGNFLGTTNAQPLVIATTETASPQPIQVWVGNQETFRFNPPGSSAPAWSIQRGGGDPRGLHVVDLQSARSATTQVASGDYSVIGGGQNNTASGYIATVSGGYGNTASGTVSTVGGGSSNTASVQYATVGGGGSNIASGFFATVGGGEGSTASGSRATVGGGYHNAAIGNRATVGGGGSNTASGSHATVGGGSSNTASGSRATVGGGEGNTASGDAATVGGGWVNTASVQYATVGGGVFNTASNFAATVAGGYQNTASGSRATVGGGEGNTASGSYSAIPGGSYLTVGARSFGFSGQTSASQTDLSANSNIAAFVDVDLWLYSRDFTNASQLRFYEAQAHGNGANYVALQAPTSLSANTTYTLPASLTTTNTVQTGILQTDASGNLSWVDPSALATAWALAGNSGTNPAVNFLGTTDAQPLVIRVNNTQTFQFNTNLSLQRDAGGNTRGQGAVDLQSARSAATRVASGNYSVIGGGQNNTASGWYATVGGGYLNAASDSYTTVGGGYNNTASGLYATVGGGVIDTASGDYSVVPGGVSNTANGAYNLVFGENVDPSVSETHRVYFFGDGSCPPFQNCRGSGFLVINRLDGDYPIHVGTNTGNGNGAYLTTGGTWTNTSSRSVKERFVQYHPAEVLEKIRQLPVEGYFYKGTEEYHITPMAEDFYRLFGTGVHEIIETDSTGQLVRRPNPEVDKYLAASDVAGVALLGVKALDERMSTLGPQNSALEQRLEQLHQENQQIKQENQQIKQENQQIKQENQHLQQRVEVLQQQNGRLQQQLEQVMERLALVEAQLQQGGSTAGENAWLGQSIPNPTDGTTVIPYYVPAAALAAELVIWNSAGAEVVRQPLPLRGQPGQVKLEMQHVASGVYQYGLVVDGRLVAQRQMVVAR